MLRRIETLLNSGIYIWRERERESVEVLKNRVLRLEVARIQ